MKVSQFEKFLDCFIFKIIWKTSNTFIHTNDQISFISKISYISRFRLEKLSDSLTFTLARKSEFTCFNFRQTKRSWTILTNGCRRWSWKSSKCQSNYCRSNPSTSAPTVICPTLSSNKFSKIIFLIEMRGRFSPSKMSIQFSSEPKNAWCNSQIKSNWHKVNFFDLIFLINPAVNFNVKI